MQSPLPQRLWNWLISARHQALRKRNRKLSRQRRALFEPLEVRSLLATLTADITGGNLVIGTVDDLVSINNSLTIVRDAADLLITDAIETFVAAPAGGTLENSDRTVRIPWVLVTGSLTANLAAGNDTLTLDLSGGDVLPPSGVSFDGGLGTDTLAMVGGVQGDVTYTTVNATSGSVNLSNFGLISYLGTDAVRNTGAATNVTFALPGAASAVTLADDGTAGNGLSRMTGAAIVATTFANPSDNLTLQNAVIDTTNVTVNALPDLAGSLTIGSDAVRFSSVFVNFSKNFATNKSLTVFAAAGISVGGFLTFAGTGSVSLTSSRGIFLSSSRLSTVDGNIQLSANQQTMPSTVLTGASILLNGGGTIEATGSGNVTLLGRGGTTTTSAGYGVHLAGANTRVSVATGTLSVTGRGGGTGLSANNYGVYVEGGAVIRGGSTGTLIVQGFGGNPTATLAGNGNSGVVVMGANSQITSLGAAVNVTGTGGGNAGNSDVGVLVGTSGVITSTLNAPVTVVGAGGVSAGGGAAGVLVSGAGQITASGDLHVEGRGGGSGSGGSNYGVGLTSGGRIFALGAPRPTTVIGYGNQAMNSTGSLNHGVLVSDGSQITSSGGPVSVTGTGGGRNGAGISVINGGNIRAALSGSVTVEGFGSTFNSTLGNNHGVHVGTTASTGGVITSGGGPVVVRGTGGSGSTLSTDGSSGVYLNFGQITTAGTNGSVTVEGRGSTQATATGNGNRGVRVDPGEIAAGNGGAVVRGWGGGVGPSSFNYGVDVVNSLGNDHLIQIRATGTGTLTVEGFGGNVGSTSASNGNAGVRVAGGFADVRAQNGVANVTGTGGGSATGNANVGILIQSDGEVSSSANITLTGNGGAGTASHGIRVNDTSGSFPPLINTTGLLKLTGAAVVDPSNFGISVESGGRLGLVNSLATMELNADAMQLTAATSILLSSARTVTLRPLTADRDIVLGGSDTANALGLDNAEINSISGPSIQIGDANTGNISFAGNITRTALAHIGLTAGTDRNIALGTFGLNANGGNLTLTNSGIGVISTGDNAGSDLAGGTVTLTAGRDIGSLANPVRVSAATLNATTTDAFYLTSTSASTTIGATGLNAAGSGYLGGGTFLLGGANRIADTVDLFLGGSTIFKLNGFTETVESIAGDATATLLNGAVTGASLITSATTGHHQLLSTVGGATTSDRTIGILKRGSSILTFGGNNNFTGNLHVEGGTVIAAHANAFGGNANGLYLDGGAADLNGTALSFGRIDIYASIGAANPVLFNSNPAVPASAVGGQIYIGGYFSPPDPTIGGVGDMTLGSIQETPFVQGLKKVGAGMLTLVGTSTYTGTTLVTDGELRVNANLSSPVVVQGGGRLSGTGLISNQVFVNAGASLSPGSGGTGSLRTNIPTLLLAFSMQAGSALNIEFGGTGVDRVLNQARSVRLGTAGSYPTLNLTSFGGFVPVSGGRYVIVDSGTSAVPVDGFFVAGAGSSLPAGTVLTEGALISNNFLGSGFGATISYVGGTGDDIVINLSATNLSLVSGNLVIADTSAAGQNDNLVLVRSGADLLITDTSLPLVAPPGFTQVNLNTVKIPFASITGNLQVSTGLGNDSFTVDMSGGDAIPAGGIVFDGGPHAGGPLDRLFFTGVSGPVTANLTSASAGSFVSSFGSLTFANVEAVTQNGATTDVAINLPTTANTLTMADDGIIGNGLLKLTATSIVPLTLANPAGTLTINRGNVADTLTVNAVADLTAGMTVGSLASPFAAVTFAGGASLAADRHLNVQALGTISFSTSSSDWVLSGTGAASLNTPRNIAFASGSSLSVVNGDLTLEANQQTAATVGDFKGIELNNAVVQSTGAGQVTVNARGGTGGNPYLVGFQYGVYVHTGAIIRGGTTGTLRVTGAGGRSNFDGDTGVKLGNNGGMITSQGANVEVTGQAGGNTTSSNFARGVDVEYTIAGAGSTQITATGTGTVTVRGTGSTFGAQSAGVRVFGPNASITSASGAVQVIGTGGLTSTIEQFGVLIEGGTVSAGGGADLLIQGTGGATSNARGHGVWVLNSDTPSGTATVSSTGGTTQIIGTVLQADMFSSGVVFDGGTVLSVGATGSLLVQGTADLNRIVSSGENDGVRIHAHLTSAGASVTFIGRGGVGNGSEGVAWGTGNVQLAAAPSVRIEGQAKGTNWGFAWGNGSTFVAPTNGTLEIVTDTLGSGLTRDFDLGTGHVSIRPYSTGVPIKLLSSSLDGLILPPALLNRLRVDSMDIGSLTSGPITIADSPTRPVRTDMTLTSSGSITFFESSSGTINTAGGSLRLTSGSGGVVFGMQANEIQLGSTTPNRLSFGAGTDVKIDIIGAFSPTGVRQLNIVGEIDLTGTDLVIGGSTIPTATNAYVLIDNDGTDPILGTFNGLPEGALINANGAMRKVTYVGGTGNDVELIANVAPAISPIAAQTVNEDSGATIISLAAITAGGESQTLQITATSSNPHIIPHPVVSYISPNTTGTLTFTPVADQFGSSTFVVAVRDAGFDGLFNTLDDAVTSRSFLVAVLAVNDAPSFTKGPDQTNAYNSAAQSVAAWATAISFGPTNEGQAVSFSVTGNTLPELFSVPPAVAANGTLTYTPASGAFGTATITVQAQDNGGTANGGVNVSPLQTFTITVNPSPTFQVTTFVPTSTGGVFNFSRNIDAAVLNLYGTQAGGLGPADVVLQGSTVGSIRGSIVIDSNLRRLTFIATNGRLPVDSYTITLRSAVNGFRDSGFELLDGDADGVAGGDHVRTFTVATETPGEVTIQLPNFARGPQQAVNVPANGSSGLPLSFSDGGGIASAVFELRYNPALLTISGAAVAPGLPAGAAVSLNTSMPGVATIQFTSETPLPAGTTRFVDLQMSVPSNAPYRSKQILDLTNIVLNGGSIPAVGDDSLHSVAYFGDVTANGTYSAQDASFVARLAVGLDSGLLPFQMLDPLIIADITGNGSLSASDTSRMLQAAVGINVAEMPALPTPAVSLIQGGPDPKLSIPATLAAFPGEQLTVPVMIDSIVDLTGNGLTSADLVLYYDATALDVTRVSLGSLLANSGGNWFVSSRIDALAGRIIVSMAGTQPLEGFFSGELVRLHSQVKADAKPGAVAINLAASSNTPSRFTQLNEGYLTLIPAPTDAANDPVDGRLLILPGHQNAASQSVAQVIDGQLLVTGTDQPDRILIGGLAGDQVRVRAGHRILGTFAAPNGVAVDGRAGDDFIFVSPTLPSAVVRSAADHGERDSIFAGDNTQAVESPDAPRESNVFAIPWSSQLESRDVALLQWLTDWHEVQRQNERTPRSSTIFRRR